MYNSSCTPWVIVILVLPAAYSIIGLQIHNGTLDVLGQLSTSSSPRTRTAYTGLRPVDEVLTSLVLFFWNVVDGTYPPIALFAVWMAGQIVCVLAVTMVEGYRTVNHKKAISYFTIWGILYQHIPWGVMMPLYFALHLVTSPAAQPRLFTENTRSRRQLVQFDNAALRVLPLSVFLGCIVPTILMALPSPHLISHDLHQVFIALWQPFPVWVGLCQAILTISAQKSSFSRYKTVETSQRLLNKTSTITLWFTALLNTVLGYTILFSENYSWGSLFARASLLQKLFQIFIPIPLADKVTVESLPKGCLALLQYDLYFACGATLLWSCILYRRSVERLALRDIIGWMVRCLVYGPGGTALFILKSRDDILFDSALEELKGD